MTYRPFVPGREGRFVFVSHAHADRVLGFEFLTPHAREGYQLWYDEGLTPTVEWAPELRQTIGACSLFVLLVSPLSVERDEVVKEILIAQELNVPILALHLQPTPLPKRLEALKSVQSIEVTGRSHDDVVGKVRAQLEAHQVTRITIDDDHGREWPEEGGEEDDSLKPAMDAGDTSLTDAFADREPESEALASSVAHQRAALLGERPVNGLGRTNVLVFYGGGGVGKSGLSQKLQRWVSGQAEELEHWGKWLGGPVVPVRWDFNDSAGDVQYAHLMRSLRQALAGEVLGADGVSRPVLSRRFLRFDLALAAYLEAVSSQDRQTLGLTGTAASGVLSSLQVIATRHNTGIPGELSAGSVRQVVGSALGKTASPLFKGFSLRSFLEDCEALQAGSEAPELVARLMYLLTEEIFRMPSVERPALVFFLDHFERVQRQSGRSHESNFTRIVTASPYCLFVIAGRNKLNWADSRRTDLAFSGPARWPRLTDQAESDPRQHSLGRLSPEDTEDLYRKYRALYGWTMSDELIARLVDRSAGLPLHIEAVLKLALSLNKAIPGRKLTAEELDQDLPEVVLQLMGVLTPKERDAFRAACVLPFFDSRLVEVVGGVQAGDVADAVTYALVEENRDSAYPYRVHDEIRRLVRQDRSSESYWGEEAWLDAARRGVEEAKRRIVAAHEAEAEAEETRAIALAVRIAAEWGLETMDLETAVTRAPSMALVAQLLPLPSPGTPKTGPETLIRLVHASALPYEQGIKALLELGDAPGRAAAIALRFAAFRLRALHRYDEALEVLGGLIESFPEGAKYAKTQYAITLRAARRFRDALDYLEAGPRPTRFRAICERRHGDFTSETRAARAANREAMKSARIRLEKDVSGLVIDAFEGLATEERTLALLEQAERRRHRASVRTCLRVLAYFHLADEPKFREIVERIEKGIDEDETNALTVAHLLSLRALLTGDPEDARAAYESVRPGPRGAVSIPVEVWLEELGYPLDPVETQWLIPYEQVRANWMKVADGIVERARAAIRP